ncbi:MAG: hypothetical protein IJ616_09245 [Bacteroidales bacterium]|nr:hypothetical protein [Bacteroidales bacterium]
MKYATQAFLPVPIASLEKIADALGIEVAELFRPSDNAKIICPHCGKAIILKAEKE